MASEVDATCVLWPIHVGKKTVNLLECVESVACGRFGKYVCWFFLLLQLQKTHAAINAFFSAAQNWFQHLAYICTHNKAKQTICVCKWHTVKIDSYSHTLIVIALCRFGLNVKLLPHIVRTDCSLLRTDNLYFTFCTIQYLMQQFLREYFLRFNSIGTQLKKITKRLWFAQGLNRSFKWFEFTVLIHIHSCAYAKSTIRVGSDLCENK